MENQKETVTVINQQTKKEYPMSKAEYDKQAGDPKWRGVYKLKPEAAVPPEVKALNDKKEAAKDTATKTANTEKTDAGKAEAAK